MEINLTRKIIVLAALLALLTGVGYYLYQKTTSQPQTPTPPEQNQQSSPSGKTPEPQITVPEGWKVFQSQKYDFSVGYPKDWVIESIGKDNLSIATVRDIGPLLSGMADYDAFIDVGCRPDFEYETLQEAKDHNSGLTNWHSSDERAEYVREINFLGLFAIERRGRPMPLSEPGYSLSINFIKDRTLFSISLFSMSKEGLLYHEATFRQMLETFSLRAVPKAEAETVSTVPPLPEGWKLYTSKEFGFALGYPTDGYYATGNYFSDDRVTVLNIESFPTPKQGWYLDFMGEDDASITVRVSANFPYKSLREAKEKRSALIDWRTLDPEAEYVKEKIFKGYFAVERFGGDRLVTYRGYSLSLNFLKDGNLFKFYLFSPTKEGLKKHELVFRQIFETISFETEQSNKN